MTRKRTEDYQIMWERIREALDAVPGDLRIRFAHFDCELAAVNSFCNVFPQVKPKMCMFHIKQCVHRKIQRLGLQQLYSSNGQLEKIVRQLGALSLLPVLHVRSAFRLLKLNLPTDDLDNDWMPGTCQRIEELFDYYCTEWINNSVGLEFTNLYDLEEGPRTTNYAEAYHSAQKQYYRAPNMPLGEWLHTYQTVQHAEESRIRDVLLMKLDPRPRDPTAMQNDAKLRTDRERLEDVLATSTEPSEVWNFMQKYLLKVGATIGYSGCSELDFTVETLAGTSSTSISYSDIH